MVFNKSKYERFKTNVLIPILKSIIENDYSIMFNYFEKGVTAIGFYEGGGGTVYFYTEEDKQAEVIDAIKTNVFIEESIVADYIRENKTINVYVGLKKLNGLTNQVFYINMDEKGGYLFEFNEQSEKYFLFQVERQLPELMF